MITLQTAASFFAIAVVLGLTPGPDNVFVLLQSAMRGPKAGMLVVLGLCTGLLVHTIAVALGLSALFAASTTAFTALKLVGAAYLLYLAWQAFRAPVGSLAAVQADPVDAGHMYRRGVIMNLTNPKVIIFFLAFLPQFVQPGNGQVTLQILALGSIFIIATLIVFCAIAYFSGAFGAMLMGSHTAQRWLNRLAGTVFVGLAVRLATAQH